MYVCARRSIAAEINSHTQSIHRPSKQTHHRHKHMLCSWKCTANTEVDVDACKTCVNVSYRRWLRYSVLE